MTAIADQTAPRREFFISRAGEDKDVALVIDAILRDAGYETFIQDHDFGHTSFMARMQDGFAKVEAGARIIAVLSGVYQAKPHCATEAHYPLIDDPDNERQRLIVLRIDDCAPTGFLKSIPYIDLVPLLNDAAAVRKAVLGAVDPENHRAEASFAALHRRSGQQIIHPEVRPVPGFSSRADELRAIVAALDQPGQRAAVTDGSRAANASAAATALHGMGGVGKSVLAQQFAWDNRGRYHGVWWLRAESRETLVDDIIALGARFNDAITAMPDRDAAARVVLDHIAGSGWPLPWLMVYDNVEAPDDIAGLTPANGAHVLITTRWADWYGHAEPVNVGVFRPDVATAFLMQRAHGADIRPDETRAGAAALADDLGGLPLALAVARAHAWRMHWSYETYRAHLAEMLERDPPKGIDYPRSVIASLESAIARAAETAPEAETLLGICAFLAPERIPLDIITDDVMSEIEKGEAVAALSEISLVTRETLDDGTAGISVHRLVQEVMRRRMGDVATAASDVALKLVSAAYPFDSDDVRFWPTCRRLEAHVLALLDDASQTGELAQTTSALLNKYAAHLRSRADYAAAEPLMRRALAIDEASFGPDHPNVARDLNNLAQLLQATNRLTEAEPLMRRALAIDEASFRPYHPSVAVRLNNLALLLKDTGRLTEAEPLMRRALAIDEASYGPDHPEVAGDLNNLALLLKDTGRFTDAEPLMRRALAIFEASLGPEHPSTVAARGNLAALLRDIGSVAADDSATPAPARAGLWSRLLGRS